MPCYTPPMSYEERLKYSSSFKRGECDAVICGLLTAHGTSILNSVDWNEVGVPKKAILQWWREHQKADRKRRK